VTPNKSYWSDRLRHNGHTGWSDPIIYGFDQVERLEAVGRALPTVPGAALDVGCGTGDFSRLLLRRGWTVTAMDPFVRPRIRHPRFAHVDRRRPIDPVDLVLAITTLGMITDEEELEATLRWIADTLTEAGHLILLEHCVPRDSDPTYLQWRSERDWTERLRAVGLEYVSSQPVGDPEWSPSEAYRTYRRDGWVRLIGALSALTGRRVFRVRPLRWTLLNILRWRARAVLAADAASVPQSSETRVLIMRKAVATRSGPHAT
jgi:SAM-dependent methyltransferase